MTPITPVALECNHCLTITTIHYDSELLKNSSPHYCPFCGSIPALGNVTIDPVTLSHFYSIHVLSPTDNTFHPTPFGSSTQEAAETQLEHFTQKYPNRSFSIVPPTKEVP